MKSVTAVKLAVAMTEEDRKVIRDLLDKWEQADSFVPEKEKSHENSHQDLCLGICDDVDRCNSCGK